ncbi:hypothetical protein [Streptomyces sp. NPDC087300]|uniref:hypothetical protein n=1 Tax=Streptomyces sp. NPDC087300 TaxID=3365780 RepID=UPI00382F4788
MTDYTVLFAHWHDCPTDDDTPLFVFPGHLDSLYMAGDEALSPRLVHVTSLNPEDAIHDAREAAEEQP